MQVQNQALLNSNVIAGKTNGKKVSDVLQDFNLYLLIEGLIFSLSYFERKKKP